MSVVTRRQNPEEEIDCNEPERLKIIRLGLSPSRPAPPIVLYMIDGYLRPDLTIEEF